MPRAEAGSQGAQPPPPGRHFLPHRRRIVTNLKLLPLAAALVALLGVRANAGDMENKRDKKLKEPFIEKGHWMLDYDKAREEAKKSGKPMLVYFTRSFAN